MASIRKTPNARRLFWPVFLSSFCWALTLLAAEGRLVLIKSWPARDLRPIPADALQRNLADAFGDRPDLIPVFNDWALRDRQRTFTRPLDVKFRSVLVGDSFLEGFFVPAPLSAFVERRWADAGHTDMEAINFGVSATGPRQYFYRIRDVALGLKPDAIMLAVYAGNDFISTPFGGALLPPVIDELPVPSMLGAVAPRTTWLTVNRLGLSEVGRVNRGIGRIRLAERVPQPPAERFDRVVGHMKQHYFPPRDDDARDPVARRRSVGRVRQAAGRPRVSCRLDAVGPDRLGNGQWKMPRDAEEADRTAPRWSTRRSAGWSRPIGWPRRTACR